jgi:hypothetical protein
MGVIIEFRERTPSWILLGYVGEYLDGIRGIQLTELELKLWLHLLEEEAECVDLVEYYGLTIANTDEAQYP